MQQLCARFNLCKSILAAVCCCGIAGFAAFSMAADKMLFAAAGTPAPLDPKDDPVWNGLRILDSGKREFRRLTKDSADETVLLLDDWSFSSKGKPSPYH